MGNDALLGKKSLEDQVEAQFGMTEEEAAAIEAEEAEKQEETEEVETQQEETEEQEESQEETETQEEEQEESQDIVIGGDPDESEAQEEKEEKTTQITEDAFFEFASKNLGKDVKSFDDLKSGEAKVEFANEQLETLNNFVAETGRDVFDWFKMQQLNVEGMDNEQLVKTQLATKYPTLKPHEINRKFDRLYKLDAEQYTEDEIADAKIDLKIDADTARTDLTKLAEGYKIPKQQERQVNDGVAQREAQRAKEAYVEQMVKEVDSISTFDFEVEGSKVKYKPSKEDRKQIKDLNQNLETFFDQFRNADGSLNTNELSEGLWKATKGNVEKLLVGVLSRGRSEGEGKQIKKRKNTQLPDNTGQKGQRNKAEDQIQEDLEAVLRRETRTGGKNMRVKL